MSFSYFNPLTGKQERFDLKECITPEDLRRMTGMRFDANDTAFFARQLEEIYTQTYDIEYPELKGRKLIPVDTRVNPGANSFTYRQFDKKGQANIVHNYADDFPNAEVVGVEWTQNVVSLGNSYQYSIQDMRAAAMAGIQLEAMKANAARELMERKLDTLSAIGDSATGLVGLTNAPNISSVTVSTGASSGQTAWCSTAGVGTGKTVAEILLDINNMQAKIFNATLGIHTPDTLVLPTSCYGFLATTARSTTFTEDSMLQYILKQSPWIKNIEFWTQLNTAGASSKGRVMLYKRDPKILQLIIPQEFEQLPPQPRNMAWVIPCHMRTGAVEVRYPLAVAYMDGCDQ